MRTITQKVFNRQKRTYDFITIRYDMLSDVEKAKFDDKELSNYDDKTTEEKRNETNDNS